MLVSVYINASAGKRILAVTTEEFVVVVEPLFLNYASRTILKRPNE